LKCHPSVFVDDSHAAAHYAALRKGALKFAF